MKAILAAVLLVPALVQAQASVAVPSKLPYQGRLLKPDGSPETGTLTLTFTIYDGGGSQAASKWNEQQTVILTNGFYAVFLGSHTALPADLFDGHERWLGIKVGGDTAELSPRHYIGSVAYAITATNALTATTANQVAPEAIGTPQLADGAVTNAKQNFGTPSAATDVVTKSYVDARFVVAGRVDASGNMVTQTGTVTATSTQLGAGAYQVTVPGITYQAIVLVTAGTYSAGSGSLCVASVDTSNSGFFIVRALYGTAGCNAAFAFWVVKL